MDIFALTETEFFRKLTDGENDNLHIAYKDFVLQVSELCNSSKCKGNVITALLLVEVEISHLQTEEGRLSVNNTLSSFISKALTFVRQTLSHYKEVDFSMVDEKDMIDSVGLNWTAKKTALIEIGYAFKVAKCFGENVSAKEIIRKLAKIFHVDMTDGYIYNKYAEMRTRARNSRTYFINTLVDSLNNFMSRQDAED